DVLLTAAAEAGAVVALHLDPRGRAGAGDAHVEEGEVGSVVHASQENADRAASLPWQRHRRRRISMVSSRSLQVLEIHLPDLGLVEEAADAALVVDDDELAEAVREQALRGPAQVVVGFDGYGR